MLLYIELQRSLYKSTSKDGDIIGKPATDISAALFKNVAQHSDSLLEETVSSVGAGGAESCHLSTH